nr:zinc finger, CCHC-type [Tanacetum cinerariifolium]
MVDAAIKRMASNFAKLDKFERVGFKRWHKKMHFLLFSMSVVYVLTTPILKDGGDDATVEQIRKKAKWDNHDYNYEIPWKPNIWLKMHQVRSYKMTDSRPFLEQYNELIGILERFTQHKMNMDESIQVSCIIDKLLFSWKDFKHTLKHLKEELTLVELGSHLRIKESLRVQNSKKPKSNNVAGHSVINMDDDVAWWIDSGAMVYVCKDRCWLSLNDGSILHIGNESTALVHGRSCIDLRFSYGKLVSLLNVLHVLNIRKNLVSSSFLNNFGYKQVTESNKFVLSKHGVFIGFGYLSNNMFRLNIVNENIGSAFMSTSKLNDSILWNARLCHVYFKRMQYMSKDGFISAFDMDTKKCKACMLTKITNKPFQNVKRDTKVLEPIHGNLCDLHATPSLGNKKYFVTFIDDALRFCYVYLLHTKDKALDKFKVFKTQIELKQGSLIKRIRTDRRGGYMDTLYFQSIGIIHEMNASYTPQQNGTSERKNRVLKEMVNSMLSYSGLSQGLWVKLFSINSIIESRDANFNENRFSSVPKPSQRSLKDGTEDIGGLVVPEEVSDQHSFCFPKTFNEAMKSRDVAFWKEEFNDEIDSIMGNNTWVLADLPPGCKPFGCKWIIKRKLKVYGTIEKFKARMVIQGFKQKSGIDYFDTYAPVARISTIRLLISMVFIHNLIIHQMDVKTAFLNVSTPMDTSEKLMPNNGQGVSQLEYFRVIGCLTYDMTYTRPDISFVVGKLSKYTSNRGTQHWQAIQRVLKYLKKIMDYRLIYTGYPLVLEGYIDASWISNTEDNSSTNGCVFLLSDGAIFWASKK